jgi:signal transduction histidine kinase
MKLASMENRSYWISIGAAIVLAIGCLLLRFQIHEFDNYLFMQLAAAISDRKVVGTSLPLLDFLFVFAECAAAVFIGFKLSAIPRSVACVQLYVVSMIAQWLCFTFFATPGHPLNSALAVILGAAVGYALRRFNQRDQYFSSQYYELTLRNRELQEARLLLVKQDEVERRVLAADLHDQVLNDLKALKQSLDADPPSSHTLELLERAMSGVREVMDNLCPSALEHLGLPAAIEDCCRRGAQRAGFKLHFKCRINESALDNLTVVEKSLLYRLAQESLTNICKHAEASKVHANVALENRQLVISIADDGKGLLSANIRSESRGLKYMRLRADLIGATVSWRAGEENKGTIVEIRKEIPERNGAAKCDGDGDASSDS